MCYHTVVCLSVCPVCPVMSVLSLTLVYCGQTVAWINMKLGMQVQASALATLCQMEIQLPLLQKGRRPLFSAHICCDQMTRWIKMPLSMEVGLGPGHIVLDGDPAPLPQKGHSRGCHLYSAGQPSRWALAHILVLFISCFLFQSLFSDTNESKFVKLFHVIPL